MDRQKNFEPAEKALCAAEMMPENEQNVAFIKRDIQNGRPIWMICASDGTRLAAVESRDYAFAAARQNNLIPLSVH